MNKTLNMKTLFNFFGVVLMVMATVNTATAQARLRVVIFTPLFLDQTFDGDNNYKYGKTSFPKHINPGLEFYQGAQMAIDSLTKTDAQLDVYIIDSKANESLEERLGKTDVKNANLIITYCSGLDEIKTFADFGLKNNIPVINANIPNSGNTHANPYFIVVNPTLRTQVEELHDYLQEEFKRSNILFLSSAAAIDNQIKSLFIERQNETGKTPLQVKYLVTSTGLSSSAFTNNIDSTKSNVVVCGIMDVNEARKVNVALAELSKKYNIVSIGMPTWENMAGLSKTDLKGLEIIYGNPFYSAGTDRISRHIYREFYDKIGSRPTDMVYRGYEVTLWFSSLLTKYGKDFASNLSVKQPQIFSEYKIQPVFDKRNMMLEYFENKKIYFLRYKDGNLLSYK